MLPALLGVLLLLIVITISLTSLPQWPAADGLSPRENAPQQANRKSLVDASRSANQAVPVAIPQNSMSARLPQANMNVPSFVQANTSILDTGPSSVPVTSIRVDDDPDIEQLESTMRELDSEMTALTDELERLRDENTPTATHENNDEN